jgi:hypothetical protein
LLQRETTVPAARFGGFARKSRLKQKIFAGFISSFRVHHSRFARTGKPKGKSGNLLFEAVVSG